MEPLWSLGAFVAQDLGGWALQKGTERVTAPLGRSASKKTLDTVIDHAISHVTDQLNLETEIASDVESALRTGAPSLEILSPEAPDDPRTGLTAATSYWVENLER